MSETILPKGFIVLATLTLCSLAADGCTRWVQPEHPVPSFLPNQHEDILRVLRNSGQTVVLRSPRVVGDSLVGLSVVAVGDGPRQAVPLSDVRSVEVRRVDGGATGGLVVLTVAAVGALYAIAVAQCC